MGLVAWEDPVVHVHQRLVRLHLGVYHGVFCSLILFLASFGRMFDVQLE